MDNRSANPRQPEARLTSTGRPVTHAVDEPGEAAWPALRGALTAWFGNPAVPRCKP